jgi:hypothetical protein
MDQAHHRKQIIRIVEDGAELRNLTASAHESGA